MRFIILSLLVACIGCSSTPVMQPTPASASTSEAVAVPEPEPCDVDPTQCFSWEEPENKRETENVIPTPLNRNDNKPKRLKK